MLLFSFVLGQAGYRILGLWPSISILYAACAAVWLLAAPILAVCGLWNLVALGRNRIPLRLGGGAAVAAGFVLVAGVLTYVIPCAGPD